MTLFLSIFITVLELNILLQSSNGDRDSELGLHNLKDIKVGEEHRGEVKRLRDSGES